MSGNRTKRSVPPLEAAPPKALGDATLTSHKYALIKDEDDVVLTDADREFLDYIADAALELYFARHGGRR